MWMAVAVSLLAVRTVSAQTDEIQVYDGQLSPPGVFNLTLHNNYTWESNSTPPFPGGASPEHSWNGVPEWAYGVAPWFEAGLYLPLYSHDQKIGWGLDGFKLRALFAVPDAASRRFFYGTNFEFSVNANRWDAKRITSEVRPIVGWHLTRFDVILNPIFDTSYDGLKNLEFVPAVRVACNVKDDWAVAAESYSDFGPVHDFYGPSLQAHQLFAVVDHSGTALDVEAGVGFGLTPASDGVTFKLILSHDLNKGRRGKR
jgi:hypothetical protein